MAATNFNPFMGMSQYRNPAGPQNGFTFTAPTQCSTLGTPRPCIETTSPINLSAPGVGASWQHSIPTTMPWMDMSAPQQSGGAAGNATVFTGMPFSVYPGPQPPSNNIPRRIKRKAVDVPPEAPLSKVHLCADQLANMRITAQHPVPSDASHQSDIGIGSNRCHSSKREQWERFRDLEYRLTADGNEKLDSSGPGETQTQKPQGLRVHLAEGVLDLASSSSPILPRKVMEDINKPCMQIVLWQSPEKLIRDITNEDCSATCPPPSSSSNPSSSSSTSPLAYAPLTGEIRSASRCGGLSADIPSGPAGMETVPAVNSFEPYPPRGSSVSATPPFGLYKQSAGAACSLSSSRDFLRPLSSSRDSPFFSASSLSPFSEGGSSTSRSDMSGLPRNNYLNHNNNNNNSIMNNNNTVMDMFDSVDDEMQL